MSSPSLLKLQGLTQSFALPDGEAFTVLSGIDLEVAAGETVAIVGPSGSGKSSLLNLIGALALPVSGRILFAGNDRTGASEEELVAFRNQQVGFVFQLHHLLPQCTALENVLLPTLARAARPQKDAAAAKQRACELLDDLGLQERHNAFPATLSGGERQRVAVARALINQPRLLLADEPTGSLDAATASDLVDMLIGICRKTNAALIMVTHSEPLASRLGRVLRLEKGKLVEVPK